MPTQASALLDQLHRLVGPDWRTRLTLSWTDQFRAATIWHLKAMGTEMSAAPKADRRIYQDIAKKLAKKINSGEYPDGSLLPSERELCKTYGASRTSVREALLSLQSSGLISMRRKARAQVTQLNSPAFFGQLSGSAQSLLAQPNGVSDFQEARVLFECGLVRYAARHASLKEIERLGLALAKNKRAISDPTLFAETDVAFHSILAQIPGNPIFAALDLALTEWLLSQRTIGIRAPIRGAVRAAYRGHEEIYEAIANHDVDAADRAMEQHLRTVSAAYWKAINAAGD